MTNSIHGCSFSPVSLRAPSLFGELLMDVDGLEECASFAIMSEDQSFESPPIITLPEVGDSDLEPWLFMSMENSFQPQETDPLFDFSGWDETVSKPNDHNENVHSTLKRRRGKQYSV